MDQLLQFLAIDATDFERVVAFKPSTIDPFTDDVVQAPPDPVFCPHNIPKRNTARGYRTVWEVVGLDQSVYKALSRRLDAFFRVHVANYPHPCAFGYVRGLNIRDNARPHCGRRLLLQTDIKDFFPSIDKKRILDLLTASGIRDTIAPPLASFLTIGSRLPLGLPTSPSIANAVCVGLDEDLHAFALAGSFIYTRYADDITVSSDDDIPDLAEIETIVQKHGFALAQDKTRASKLGQAHFVTGLSVSDPNAPHIPKERKRRLRQELYYARKFGLLNHLKHVGIQGQPFVQSVINSIDGTVKYVAFHEPTLTKQLSQDWHNILKASGKRPSFAPRGEDKAPLTLVFDEAEFDWRGRHWLALGCSVSEHQDTLDRITSETLDAELGDMWAAGKTSALEEKGLHFADATLDLRLSYIEKLQTLPFSGYVAIAILDDSALYEATYIRLLRKMIRRRLVAANAFEAHLAFEQNDKVRRTAIESEIATAFDALKTHDNRRPKRVTMSIASKPDPRLSPPDFLLGALAGYLRTSELPKDPKKPPPREIMLFERLRDKYRVILDLESGVEYSRRRPI